MISLATVKRGHKRFAAAHENMVSGALETASKSAMAEIVLGGGGTGFKHRTGAIILGQKNTVYTRRGKHVLKLENVAPHAKWLEHGTKPHFIRPRNKDWLYFHWPKAGGWVFSQLVFHPGTRAYHFLSGARDRAFEKTGALLRIGMRTVARYF